MRKKPHATALGRKLAEARERAGLHRYELSLGCGLARDAVRQVENGMIVGPRAGFLGAVARTLGCSLDWLVLGQGAAPTDSALAEARVRTLAAVERRAEREDDLEPGTS